MKIELKNVSIRDLFVGYTGDKDDDVLAFDGKLNARPVYQRNFVYNDVEKKSVIASVLKGYPLNVMYWVDNGDDSYELLDGQQRTLSICEYLAGNFSIIIDDYPYEFHNLEQDQKDKILNYELSIYVCKNGTATEKLAWFETINIAGKKLTDQELRNAIYHGTWVSDAKKWFSKNSSPAPAVAGDYMKVEWQRQEGLQKVIDWIKETEKCKTIKDFMQKHQNDANANKLWEYFNAVMTWAKTLFPKIRKKEMQGQDWGLLYNANKGRNFDAKELENEIAELMQDSEVESKKGIYEYIFDRDQRHLSLRTFDDNVKRSVYEKQGGICPMCKGTPNEKKKWDYEEMEGDHDTPWSKGGKTVEENCVMLCRKHNREKSDK